MVAGLARRQDRTRSAMIRDAVANYAKSHGV
jgi:predicted transcriptional regulator